VRGGEGAEGWLERSDSSTPRRVRWEERSDDRNYDSTITWRNVATAEYHPPLYVTNFSSSLRSSHTPQTIIATNPSRARFARALLLIAGMISKKKKLKKKLHILQKSVLIWQMAINSYPSQSTTGR